MVSSGPARVRPFQLDENNAAEQKQIRFVTVFYFEKKNIDCNRYFKWLFHILNIYLFYLLYIFLELNSYISCNSKYGNLQSDL